MFPMVVADAVEQAMDLLLSFLPMAILSSVILIFVWYVCLRIQGKES
jgi:hypothetical protein